MDKLLEKLIAPVSVSGCENAVAEIIKELAAPYGDVARDTLGNLVLHKAGKGKRIMLAAHMDTVGVVATYLEEGGFVRFGTIGGIRLIPMIGQRVRFESGVLGVICPEPDVEQKDLTAEKLYIDTFGQEVEIGETATFCEAPQFINGKVVSHGLDNRLGCAVCLRAMELLQETENDIFCTFTVQEEVGRRGARPVAYSIVPDLAIAVDICTALDIPGGKKKDNLTLEGGPVIKYMDARSISHKAVVSLLERTAAELELPFQRYVTNRGGTDASMILNSRGGVPAGTLSIPIRSTHTANEVADLRVAEQCARLLAAASAK